MARISPLPLSLWKVEDQMFLRATYICRIPYDMVEQVRSAIRSRYPRPADQPDAGRSRLEVHLGEVDLISGVKQYEF